MISVDTVTTEKPISFLRTLPASSFIFLIDTEFTEVAYQDILVGFQRVFDDFEEGFYKF